MIYGGFKNGYLIIGETESEFQIKTVEIEKLKEIKIDYGYCFYQATVNNGLYYKRIKDVKEWLGNIRMLDCLLLKEVLKRGFQTDDNDIAIAWCFYQMAIEDSKKNADKVQRKRKRRQSLVQSRDKIIKVSELRLKKAEKENNNNTFNFDLINWHSSENLQKLKKRKNSIKVDQAQRYGFKQIFNGGRLFINDKKQLLFRQEDYLFPIYQDDYIIQE